MILAALVTAMTLRFVASIANTIGNGAFIIFGPMASLFIALVWLLAFIAP
jgi:hypothetical protein